MNKKTLYREIKNAACSVMSDIRLIVYGSYARNQEKKYSDVDAFLFSCFVTFSCVLLIPITAAGYTDMVTYFFLFLAFTHAGTILKSALFFSLALLNHESSIFSYIF